MRPVVDQSKHNLFPPVKSFIHNRVFTTSSEIILAAGAYKYH